MIIYKNAIEVAPCIILIEDAIENSEEIIQKAMQQKESLGTSNAKIFTDKPNDQQEDFLIRKTLFIDISPNFHNDVFWWLTAQKIFLFGDQYGKQNDISFRSMEPPQFLWYKKNEGFYRPHMDNGPDCPRVFSAILYLNDVSEGGETHFENFNISIKPKKNSLLLFPANFAYLHGAKTPISEDKFVIVTWFNP